MSFELIPQPYALPAVCFKCNTGQESRDWFIDFNFNMEMFGAVIICNECVVAMAHAAGMITATEATKLTNENSRLKELTEELKTTIFGLEQAIDGLRIAGSVSRVDPDVSVDLGVDSTEQDSQLGESNMVADSGEIDESSDDTNLAGLSDANSNGAGVFKLSL